MGLNFPAGRSHLLTSQPQPREEAELPPSHAGPRSVPGTLLRVDSLNSLLTYDNPLILGAQSDDI